MEFQGYVSNRRSPFYVALLLPLVTIKNGINLVRGFFHRLIWTELTQKITPKESSPIEELMTILTLGIFCLLCVFTYKFYLYYSAISIFVGCCWYMDIVLSKRNYAHKISLNLTLTKDNYLIWELQSVQVKKFHRSNLVGIGISRVQILSNAFETAIAQPWQIFLILRNKVTEDDTNLIIHEDPQILKVLVQVKELSQFFQVPMTFLNTQENQQIKYQINGDKGTERNPNPDLECNPKFSSEGKPKGITLRKHQHKWHIFSQWTNASSGYFFGKVFSESGFLLFTLFLTEFMSRFGHLIDSMISHRGNNVVYIDFGVLLSGFGFSWLRVIEVAIAIGVMIWKGIQISQVKHIYIDSNYLKYGINHRQLAQLNLATIESIVLINHPEPVLIAFDGNATIEIKDLLTDQDYRVMFLTMQEGLLHWQKSAQNLCKTNFKDSNL